MKIREQSAIGIKPISEFGSKRLVRKAIEYAIAAKRDSVTLVHKGNIMKFTEGAFKDWGYQIAREEFGDVTIPESEVAAQGAKGRIVIKDRIADNMFQQVLLRPADYSVIATTNLNGDYLSDALAAQVGGLGIAPGSNESDEVAIFEATHGTAPKYANQDVINPGSLILSGVMMLRHMKWHEAADAIERGMSKTIAQKKVTYDLERLMQGATKVKTSEFARYIVENKSCILLGLASFPLGVGAPPPCQRIGPQRSVSPSSSGTRTEHLLQSPKNCKLCRHDAGRQSFG